MKPFEFARKEVERLYCAKCQVYAYITTRDPETKQSRQEKELFISDQPCRIAFESNSTTIKSNDTVYEKPQTIKLFIAPELIIAPGSIIEVVQNGRTETYKSAGESRVYVTHQEIALEIAERWA